MSDQRAALHQAINLRLTMLGHVPVGDPGSVAWAHLAAPLLARQHERTRAQPAQPCPADTRIQSFLYRTFGATGAVPRLPAQTFVLDRAGLARELSLPFNRDEHATALLKSYRLHNGVLHNPVNDRRTTQGVFHIVGGGTMPVPDDKLEVPPHAFVGLLDRALRPPADLLALPFTAGSGHEAPCFASLLLRPLVVPAVPGFTAEKRMEIRFFAPGSLVANLDFVESIFGNGGDPYLPDHDAALAPAGWTGHTGCVILAPHLTGVTKRELGLPHHDQATPRQRRDGMCWRTEDERYNGGSAFKVCARDASGVVVTLIADNYFGYCKKEVKTQISFSANLHGLAEEEHAGGALVFPSYDLGDGYSGNRYVKQKGYSFADVARDYTSLVDIRPEGYGVDRQYPDILYVAEHTQFDLSAQRLFWQHAGREFSLPLRAGCTYVRPSGYKITLERQAATNSWRLVGTLAEATLCHKPCTVSGGGKSEISKAISDAILPGSVFIADFERDMQRVADLVAHDYSDRFRDPARRGTDKRPILSVERSLGSVIKLLTPSDDYSDAYNEWLRSIPHYLREIVFVVKRHYVPAWGERWREHFSADVINGHPGNELKCDNRKLVASYLRVGYETDGTWRVFGLREDFQPAAKVQMEDDITASVVVPAAALGRSAPTRGEFSQKFVENCEQRLFQRPDDAIHRGYDRFTESQLAAPGNFISNFEPLSRDDARKLMDDAIGFARYTAPMQDLVRRAATDATGPAWFVSSAHPRLVDGKPSKNPRYLQIRPDLADARSVHLALMCTRLYRRLPADVPVLMPVDAQVPGRRNNPPEAQANIRSLAVFNPLHYFELPELFMEFISSMTGKSPSTTGAGSEGALTKGPFNCLPAIIDLNAALVSNILTGLPSFVSAAGYVGPRCRVDHDISLLIPEVWSRLKPEVRDPAHLIAGGYLEKCEDFTHDGRLVQASRLGWRITEKFAREFLARLFTHPHSVFTEAMLRPETQDLAVFADGMDNICSTHQRVAQSYFDDGTIALACPPLRALLEIMTRGATADGLRLDSPAFRALFTRENLLASDWYRARLDAKQALDVRSWQQHVRTLETTVAAPANADLVERLGLRARLESARAESARVATPDYRTALIGTLGVQPLA